MWRECGLQCLLGGAPTGPPVLDTVLCGRRFYTRSLDWILRAVLWTCFTGNQVKMEAGGALTCFGHVFSHV
jgi:hypothetical protein